MQQGQLKSVEKKAKRWDKGDLTGNDPVAIPVTPQTTSFASDKTVAQIRIKLGEQIQVIFGGKNAGTQQETQGLIKDGDDLIQELHKLAISK
jgi:hypothetical protein